MTHKSSSKICPCIIIAVIFASLNVNAQNQEISDDSVFHVKSEIRETPKFQPKQLILPATLVAVGSFGVCNGAFHNLNNSIRDGVANLRNGHYFRADDHIQYLPVISYLGLGALGVNCKHSFKERFAAGATAYLAMGIMVNATKYAIREKRPDSDARNSFPSGHTATVFMGAELIRQEYGLGISIGAYAIATGVAFLRIYNDRHWLNDVIAGAGFGILSARIGYWMLPLYQKWLHWNKSTTITAMPSYNISSHSIGIGMVATF
ncbi:MAG: phosphatase PAP2 family protein [Muribaculaceae bacterium]|nr:phosphatase PAP2 family protein [Muribaculaceae bacterium]